MDYDVSVIIVNYKTAFLIHDCILSLIELTKDINYEVIVVDNASEPDFKEKITYNLPYSLNSNFHYISLPENVGFGRANNAGLKIAKGRNIFFLNPDTVLLNNAIKILSDFLDNNPEAGACGGNLVDGEGKPTYSHKYLLPGIFWELNELLNDRLQKIIYGKINHYYNQESRPKSVAYITGADLMVKRDVLENTGSFSPEFFMYFEETDLCNRIIKSGKKIYNVPQALIKHLESKSFNETEEIQSELKTEWLEKSRLIYYSRNHNWFNRRISNFIYECFLNSRIILIRNNRKRNYYKLRKRYYILNKRR